MTTNHLLLKRYLEEAASSDHVDWAVWGLCNELDSPSLRILGGLHPDKETDEIRFYFKRTCRELNLQTLESDESPRLAAPLIHSCFVAKDLTAREAICTMAQLYKGDDFRKKDPLFAVWDDIAEAIYLDDYNDPDKDMYYPANQRSDLNKTFDTEWSFFHRGLNLGVPESGGRLMWCRRHETFAPMKPKPPGLARRILRRISDSVHTDPFDEVSSACGCRMHELDQVEDWTRRSEVFDLLESGKVRS